MLKFVSHISLENDQVLLLEAKTLLSFSSCTCHNVFEIVQILNMHGMTGIHRFVFRGEFEFILWIVSFVRVIVLAHISLLLLTIMIE